MIDVPALQTRFQGIIRFLDERRRRLFAANEALALGHGGVTAVSEASGIARRTIYRGSAEMQGGVDELRMRYLRLVGRHKREIKRQPLLQPKIQSLNNDQIRA